VKYISSWYGSVQDQTDHDFDLWIGIDGLEIYEVVDAMGAEPPATWLKAEEGDSPAQIRQRAIERMVDKYSAVVFVDCDDLLAPTRLEAARRSLEQTDVSGCAMRIIDASGNDLNAVFKPPAGVDVATILPRNNVFGLSNTAYRSQILRRCLPIPAECILADWFLVTRAWASGARLSFDYTTRMAYRQYPNNIGKVLCPFTSQQILVATGRVLNHYECVLTKIRDLQPNHINELESAHSRARAFHRSVTSSPVVLRQYVWALNNLGSNPLIWWDCVAHPQLEEIWSPI
jgi:hypothetical protein